MHPIRDDVAATHDASALALGLFILCGSTGRNFAHYSRDVGSLDRLDPKLADQRHNMVREISAILRDARRLLVRDGILIEVPFTEFGDSDVL